MTKFLFTIIFYAIMFSMLVQVVTTGTVSIDGTKSHFVSTADAIVTHGFDGQYWMNRARSLL